MNREIAAMTFLLLVVFAAVPQGVFSQTDSSAVMIIQVTPNSGPAGSQVRLQGTIASQNGSFQILIARSIVASGTAYGFTVNANFTVPELLAASYPLVLKDVKSGVDSYSEFTVATGYSITTSPSVLQEGGSVTLSVAATGAQLGTSYDQNIAVTTPNGKTYSVLLPLGIPNTKGTVSAQIIFPDSFPTEGATTGYVGTYRVTFGETLASNHFVVRLLDANNYHRGDIMKIHATGYQPNQAVTITITNPLSTWIESKSTTASSSGVIDTTWAVSSSIPIGESTIKITPDGVVKTPADQQTFTIIGYLIQVQVNNLAERPIPNIVVQTTDTISQSVTNSTTNSTGGAIIRLERGSYNLVAYLNGLNIGKLDITITGDDLFTLVCNLADLTITALNLEGAPIPFVALNIKYNYQSGTISRSGTVLGQTGPLGTYTLTSALAGATYTIDASLYGQVFNNQNNTATTSPSKANSYITIICPKRNVTMTVIDYDYQAIPNVRLELVELSSGFFYSSLANAFGVAEMEPTFGMYRVRVYKDNTLINQVNLQVFNNSQKEVRCALYGIQLSVAVVDMLGSPIPNANVTLNGSTRMTTTTESDGIATFNSVIGGNMQIIAQPEGTESASQAIMTDLEEPKTVQVRIDNYVSVGGLLLQTSTFVSIIVVFMGVLLFIAVEIIRRKKNRAS